MMKTCYRFLPHFIILIFTSTLSIAQTKNQQTTSGTENKEKKKGSFWKNLGNAIVDDVKYGSNPGPGTTSNKSGSILPGKSIVIENGWTEYGGGGSGGIFVLDFTEPSPRNHMYYFEITEPNVKITFKTENDMHGLAKAIVSEYNASVNHYLDLYTFERPGIYKLQFAPRYRYTFGKYRAELIGPVKNLRQETYPRFVTGKKDFGEEGAGGSGVNLFSSRNHRYQFEGEVGSVIDINAESNGVKLKMALIDPFGAIKYSTYGGNPGLAYIVQKIEKPGVYKLYVATEELDAKCEYRLDIMGKTKTEPVQDEVIFKKVNGQFTKASTRHEYKLTVDKTILEMIYRSTTTKTDIIQITDKHGEHIEPHMRYDATQQIRNRSWFLKEGGEYTLILDTQEPGEGKYELLFWGKLTSIESKNISAPENKQVKESKNQIVKINSSDITAGKIITDIPEGKIRLIGQVDISKVDIDISDIKVIYEDLSTGEKLGETVPGNDGKYILLVDGKTNLGISGIAPDNSIVTSINLDLSKQKEGTEVRLKPINVLQPKTGTVFSLNNIFFETGNPVLLRSSYPELKRIAAIIRANPDLTVEISGHTDNIGSPGINQTLSQNRAKAVLYYLQDQVPEAKNLIAKGYGPGKPIADNKTVSGKQLNRRVEFRIL